MPCAAHVRMPCGLVSWFAMDADNRISLKLACSESGGVGGQVGGAPAAVQVLLPDCLVDVLLCTCAMSLCCPCALSVQYLVCVHLYDGCLPGSCLR
jgi:hypothetical protein